MLLWRDYVRKLKSVEHQNIVGIWPQSERSGSVAKDHSRHGHDGTYSNVWLPAAGPNLLSNPGFETAGGGGADIWANWVETAGTGALANEAVVIHEGSDAAKITAGATFNTRIAQPQNLYTIGKKYRLRFYTQGDGTNAGRYYIYDVGNATYLVDYETTGISGAAYAQFETTFIATDTNMQIGLACPPVNTAFCYFDACEVRTVNPNISLDRKTVPTYNGMLSYNDIHSAGLANDNLLSNPGFETAGAGDPDFWANWSETVGGTAALANEAVVIHEGSDAAKMTAGNNQALVRQDITVVSGKKYRLRFWTRGDGTNQGRYKIYDNDNSVYTVEENTGVAGAAYAAVVKEFTAPAGCTSMAVLLLSAWAAGIAYFDACEVRSMDGFLGDEGTLLAWAKVSAAGVWTDATWRFMVGLQVDVNNRIYIAKSQAVNSIRYRYGADSVMEDVDTAGETATGWMVVGITWDKAANQFIAYRDGAQEGAIQAIAGTWVGDLSANGTVIGAQTDTPACSWSGSVGPVALWNKALSADQIAYLSKV